MQQLKKILTLAVMMQASFFALEAKVEHRDKSCSSNHCDQYGPVGLRGPTGPAGAANVGFENYACFFLTTGSDDLDIAAGDNVLFNEQLALSGIEYDSESGIFTLSPGTYAVTYFFAPFSIPSVNMYVNDQLILNSPLGGSSTVFTVTEASNTLTLQYITAGSFSAPSANQSWASIAIFQID